MVNLFKWISCLPAAVLTSRICWQPVTPWAMQNVHCQLGSICYHCPNEVATVGDGLSASSENCCFSIHLSCVQAVQPTKAGSDPLRALRETAQVKRGGTAYNQVRRGGIAYNQVRRASLVLKCAMPSALSRAGCLVCMSEEPSHVPSTENVTSLGRAASF